MSLLLVIDALEAAGVDAKAIIAAVRAHELRRQADEDARRAKAADKKRRQRASALQNVPGTIGDNGGQWGTSGDGEGRTGTQDAGAIRAGAQVVISSLPHLRSEEVGGGVGKAREPDPNPDDWPDGKASDHADQLLALVDSPWLDQNKSPDLVTTRGRLAAWKRDGASWEHDVLPVVTGLCANRRSRISTWKFFDQAISRSIAENRAALEIPEASTIVPFRAQGPPRTIDEKSSASWDYAIARIAEDEQSAN